MKVALYTRVSTEEQAKEGFSLSAQLEKMKAFCFSQGWQIYKEFTEEGRSAKDLERPQLQSLLKEMNHFDVVLVYKLDRLSRNVSDINILLNTFEKNNVAFKSVTEPYDTTTAQGKLLINIFASLAQFERDQLAERTHMGMTRKHEEGQRNGGNAPFGYDLINGELVINPEESKWVKFIFDQFELKGRNVIAKELNRNGVRSKKDTLFNPSMVTYIAKNPVYYGYLRWNYRHKNGKRTYEEIIVPGKHKPIITKEQFDKVNRRMKERVNKGHKGHAIYPFTGILKCKRCGKKLNGAKRNKADGSVYRFYKCSGRFTQGICDMPVIGENVVDFEFANKLNLDDIEFQVPTEESVDIKAIEKELKKVRSRIERLEELYIDGDIPKKKYRERLEIEQKKETELSQSLNVDNETMSPEEIKETIHDFTNDWSELSFEERKKWVHLFFDYIEIECHSNHKGGNDTAIIEITDYALAQ
jgi:site-specific DNA recombinase